MNTFEILCVTMHQTDFSKLREMNIHSNVVFANQADTTSFEQLEFEGHTAKMITTNTRGVGINRNLALMYASGDICLFADDDVHYVDNVEHLIIEEFKTHPDADIFVFNLDSGDSERKQVITKKTRKVHRFDRMPWGGCRIAIRRTSVQKANIWFTTLFGGGCLFPSGEDSMWLTAVRRKGLRIYQSSKMIGSVSFDSSTWFSGFDRKYYFGRGAFYQAIHPISKWLWYMYIILRTKKKSDLTIAQMFEELTKGSAGYKQLQGYPLA